MIESRPSKGFLNCCCYPTTREHPDLQYISLRGEEVELLSNVVDERLNAHPSVSAIFSNIPQNISSANAL
jgi:hypothetical protein